MTSSDCLPKNNLPDRVSTKSRLNLPVTSVQNGADELTKSASTTSTPSSSSPNLYFTPIAPTQIRLSHPNMFNFPRPPPPPPPPVLQRKNIRIEPPEQDVLDENFIRVFNIAQPDGKSNPNSENQPRPVTTDQTKKEDPNLIDMGVDTASKLPDGTVFELFDPLTQQSQRPSSWPTKFDQTETRTPTPPFVTPSSETPPIQPKVSLTPTFSTVSTEHPYPIKLRLKLTAFPEIKPFCQLVQQIRNEHQTEKVLNHFLHLTFPLLVLHFYKYLKISV